MKSWGVVVCLAAFSGIQVFAEPQPLAFIENVRGSASSRIVSGWEATEGQIPWQLSLRMVSFGGGVSSCGGSIIHSEWGMTAAHCTANRVTMVLRAGAVSLWRPELMFETTEYYNHPWFIEALAGIVQPHDIALLKFQRSITFTERVQPVRLQPFLERDRNYDSVRLMASGWGRTWTDGASPDNLQWVYLRGNSNAHCWNVYGGSSIIVESTICASYYNVTSQSTCQGDSGGPLVELDFDGEYTMVGVTSFVSRNGCHAGFPAGFIRPGHYHGWFTDVTGIDFDWVPLLPTTTETPTTTEADGSDESSESSSSESDSEESEETTTTEAATEETTTEAATTEAATTEAETEATTEAVTVTTEAETEVTTEAETEGTTEAATEGTTEAATEGTTEAATEGTTEAATEGTTEAATEGTTEAATEGTTEAETEGTTEAATEGTTEAETEGTTEAATEGTTEAETEGTTGAATEGTTEAETEGTTEAATEGTTEAATEGTTEAATEGTTEAATEGTTEAETEGTTEAATEGTTEAETEGTTEAATEGTTEAATEGTTGAETEGTTEAETVTTENATTEAATTEEATTEAENEDSSEEATTEAPESSEEEDYRSFFSYFRAFAKF